MNVRINKKLYILAAVLAAILIFIVFDLGRFLSLDYLVGQKESMAAYVSENPFLSAFIFIVVYIWVAALSLPGAAILTLAAGALFGVIYGSVYVSFASSIGATAAFLISRSLFHDWVQERFSSSLKKINQGVEKDGALYLFGLRLVPLFPFFVINLVMGLTPIKTWKYYVVSQIGMFPATVVYVNAGTQLSKLESASDILSPGLIFSFVLLGVFPFIAKALFNVVKSQKVYAAFKKPKVFDANLIVIGAGSAGLVTSYIAAASKAKVYLIEKHRMGGDCLNTGCVPSKAIIRSAKIAHYIRRAAEFGIRVDGAGINFKKVMERVHSTIKQIEPHDSVARYEKLGVKCLQGEAKIIDPWTVAVGDTVLTTKSIVIATGGSPATPNIEGLKSVPHYDSNSLWGLQTLPKKLLVLGGGPIGCELAQAFRRLGSQVSLLSHSERLMSKEDNDISAYVEKAFEKDGIELLLAYRAVKFHAKDGEYKLLCENRKKAGKGKVIPFDAVILATGRKANTKGFGIEKLNITLNANGTIAVNPYLQTNYPNIYACGDVAGPYQFTHVAAHQAWYASVNAMFGMFKRFKVDYRVIPWSTFTDPEVARVGLSELEADEQGIEYEVTRYGIDDLDRAIADGEAHGVVKVLTVPGKDKILGACIVGHHAGDLLAEFVLAMKHGLGLNKILGTIHIYPTLAESNKYVAGNWRRAHVPEKIMSYLPKLHAWLRGEK